MTTTSTLVEAQQDIIKILELSGLIRGEGSKYNPQNTFFWNMVVKGEEASKAAKYVIWNVIANNPEIYADNLILSRKITAEIIIYSRYPSHNPAITKIITDINNSMLENKYTFEMVIPPTYDVENQMYIYDFECVKEYYGQECRIR